MKLRIIGRILPLLIIGLTGALTGSLSHAGIGPEYFDNNIKPLFESRCIQCHSCYNAPCQLNLGSIEGLDRGVVNNFDTFNPNKLRPAAPSRLGIDRKTTEEWRHFSKKIHFMPVTQDTGNKNSNRDMSFILKLVEHKKANSTLVVDHFKNENEMSENSRVCPDVPKKLDEHLISRPNAGMPYGLPSLSEIEIERIKNWTDNGSPRVFKPTPLPATDVPTKHQIEIFFNSYLSNKNIAEAKRQSLTSRYIFEHLFLAHIYLHQEKAPTSFYSLIRSRSSCEAPDEIATRRPWDDTKLAFFYCLKRIDAMLVNKTHMPYLIDENKLLRWHNLFYSTPWQVSFQGKKNVADVAPRNDSDANNPFFIYKDIPTQAKYQFLLDDAQYHVMTFIKGPVCKGNTAVNSIDEQFYAFFIKPSSDLMVRNKQFINESIANLYLPASKGSGEFLLVTPAYFQRGARERYRLMRDQYYGLEFPKGYSVNDVWNGRDESATESAGPANDNAALTIFRHEDSAAVVKGLVGATSKTVFVMDYSILERFCYNLVVGFDVAGDVGHQLHTRLYMSYIKMEAEENFLSFLPRNVRSPMRRSWYLPSNSKLESADKFVGDKIAGNFPLFGLDKDNQVNLPALDQNKYDHSNVIEKLSTLRGYRRELVDQFKQRLGSAVLDNNQLNPDKPLLTKSQDVRIADSRSLADFEIELAKVSDLPALNSKWILKMPSAALLLVEGPNGAEVYSMIRNKEHLNIAWLDHESGRRNEIADTMVFAKGVLTSYPNFIFSINLSQSRKFLQQMMAITDHASYDAWTRAFGNPRSGPGSEKFWQNSDRIHEVFRQNYPLEFGSLDYNRYGSDYRYHEDGNETFFKNLPATLRMSITEELRPEASSPEKSEKK